MGFLSKDQLAGIMSAVKVHTSDVSTSAWNSAKRYTNEHTYVYVTYDELCRLQEGGGLTAGTKYRIYDYSTTTSCVYTTVAGQDFDIIVTALNNRTLDENARAIYSYSYSSTDNKTDFEYSAHYNNIYAYCLPESWEIKYCLKNDKERFSWADDIEHQRISFKLPKEGWVNENGESITEDNYSFGPMNPRLYDENYFPEANKWGVDLIFLETSAGYNHWIYKEDAEEIFNNSIESLISRGFMARFIIDHCSWGTIYGEFGLQYIIDGLKTTYCNGKGVIYYMKDEWGNEAPYDFKNIMFKRWKVATDIEVDGVNLNECYLGYKRITDSHFNIPPELYIVDDEDYEWVYTFNARDEYGGISEASLNNVINCFGNKILPYKTGHTQHLNDIVLFGSSESGNRCIENNTFETNCYSMTIGSKEIDCELWENKFGQFAKGNILNAEMICQNNFGQNLTNNIIISSSDTSQSIMSNVFNGNYCQNNFICAYFGHNKIGDAFKSNRILARFHQNVIGDSFANNTISQPFTLNYIDEQCKQNTFSGEFTKNNLKAGFLNNEIYGLCTSSNFGVQTTDNKIFTQMSVCDFGNNVGNNEFNNVINSRFGGMFVGNKLGIVKACDFGIGFRYNTLTNSAANGSNVRVSGCKFGDYVWYTNFYNTGIAVDSTSAIQNINVQSSLQGTETNILNIEVPKDSPAEIKVARNSNGDIKVYCEADLIA